jgi:hypothetical protein
MNLRDLLLLTIAWVVLAGCDRNMEPFVPGEKPRQPDLSKIFPAGAERSASRGAPAAASARGMGRAPVAGSGKPIEGKVEIDQALSSRIPAGAVLFLIVRHGSAGPPIAVKRILSPRFPVDFAVGPEDRMTEKSPFVGPLQITARLDADGNATTQEPGNLEGRLPDPVAPGDRGLTVTIDEIL